MEKPRVLEGGLFVDDRGSLLYTTDVNFPAIRRFYVICNHEVGFVRAWHAHKEEAKYVWVLHGAAFFGCKPIEDWEHPKKNIDDIFTITLVDFQPRGLYVPPGYAHGFKTLKPDTKVLFFSTATLESSKQDDYRWPAQYWNLWYPRWR